MVDRRGVYMILVQKPEGKRPLGRCKCRWEDNIKGNLQELGFRVWTGFNWLRVETGVGHL
jgi:hypothetical protein